MGTIAEKLQAVASSKAAIASAIQSKGGTVPTKLSDYGTAVSSLPNTYTAGDEGKVVSNGALVSQTSLTITENNTYDTTTKNSVTVNVSGGGGGGGPFAALVDRSITTVTTQDLSGVTSIGSDAFRECTRLSSISIPNSVTSIGDEAFYNCSGLSLITIGNGVTRIGNYAFNHCTGLTSITIPDGVTRIGDWAFGDCSGLTSVTIPDGVASIGPSTFYGCSGLTSISIPDSVTSIGSDSFHNCSGLTSISIPDGVTRIGGSAFRYCSNLATIDFGTTRSTIPTLGNVSAFNGLPANYQILVPSALLDTWKATNNWNNSAVVDHIVAHT